MSHYITRLKPNFATLSILHTMVAEHEGVVPSALPQEEGCPLEKTLPVEQTGTPNAPLTREKETASESEAKSGHPVSFEKIFLFIEKVLYSERVAVWS